MTTPSLLKEALDLFDYSVALRRDLHRHPELGFQERRTSALVAEELRRLELEVVSGIAETGVVAVLHGEQPGPTVMLRFDMDALPIHEENECEYTSAVPGVMHACGHDGHTAIGLTVAHLLVRRRATLHGTVKFVFQPAEEGLGGAQRMIEEGVLQSPRPQVALGLHLWNEQPIGWVGITPGPMMAAADRFDVSITGKGGHAALPHETRDPIVAAAQMICALQTIVSRNIPPTQSAVLSVASVQGGQAFNVLPSQVHLSGTLRTFEAEIRRTAMERLSRLTEDIAQAFGCQAQVSVQSLTPALVNDPQVAGQLQRLIEHQGYALRVDRTYRSVASEDMAFFLEQVPGCFFFLGSANAERGLNAPHHHPRFDFDEQALPLGAALLAEAALHFGRQG